MFRYLYSVVHIVFSLKNPQLPAVVRLILNDINLVHKFKLNLTK